MERKTRRRLVFENEGSTEAQQVRWRLEKEEGVEGELPWAGDDQGGSGLIPVIAGGAKYEIALWPALEPRQFRCAVDWKDNDGNRHNETTLSM